MSSNELRKQIYRNLSLKETDELIDIWQSNNRYEWSDEAFESIRMILQERGVEIPEQNEPIYEYKEVDERDSSELLEDRLEEWEAKALDAKNQPEFYDTIEVITLKDNINKTAKAVIFVNILGGLTTFQFVRSIIESYFPNREGVMPLIYFIAFIFASLSVAISIAIVYFPLKALVHILRILMEMEFRSRKAD
jgi:predicted house-cleaning noncanonical NTP pyrophosphatase (MazG superfamily)